MLRPDSPVVAAFPCRPVYIGLPDIPGDLAVDLAARSGAVTMSIRARTDVATLNDLETALHAFVRSVITWYSTSFRFDLFVTFEVALDGLGVDVAPYLAMLDRVPGIHVGTTAAGT